MNNFNINIDKKLRTYPENVQDIARRAINMAKKVDASKIAVALESKVKSLARKGVVK